MGSKKVWLPIDKRLSEENGEEDSNNEPSRWPELTDLVLQSISMRLPAISDFVAFSGVCRPWRSFSKSLKREYMSSSHPPLLMYYHPGQPRRFRHFYSIRSNKISRTELPKYLSNKHIGSYHGCLIMLDWSNSNPHSQPVVLVSLSTGKKTEFPISNLPIGRLVVLSSPPTSPDCLLVSADSDSFEYNLQCCQRSDSAWTVLLQGRSGSIIHVAAIKNKVYALIDMHEKGNQREDQLLIFELALHPKTSVMKTERLQLPGTLRGRHRVIYEMQLVQFDDDILLICSYCILGEFTVGEFQLYRLLELDCGRSAEWEKVEDLGGCALFLFFNGSVVSREPGRWGGMENSIYFIERYFHTKWGVYSLKSASVVFRSGNLPTILYCSSPVWVPRELCF